MGRTPMSSWRCRGYGEQGTKSEVATSPLSSRGPQVGGIAMSPRRSWGPRKRGQNEKWPHHPCLLGATSGRNCDLTLAFSGISGTGNKIRSGYITPTFSEGHKWAE